MNEHERAQLLADVKLTKEKVQMLNDWHLTVDERLGELRIESARIVERTTWVLRIAVALFIVSLGDKFGLAVVQYLIKFIGG